MPYPVSVPAPDAPLPPFPDAPRLDFEAGSPAPLLATGRLAAAVGSVRAGLTAVHLNGVEIQVSLEARGFPAANASAWPGGWERRLDAGDGAVRERVFVARDLPVVLLELVSEAAAPVEARFGFTETVAGRAAGEANGPSRHRRATVITGGEAIAPGEPVAVSLRPAESRRIAVVGASADPDDPAIRALRSAESLVYERDVVLGRLRREHLTIDAPDPAVAVALEWAKARLDAYPAEVPGAAESASADEQPRWRIQPSHDAGYWLAIATYAVGLHEAGDACAVRAGSTAPPDHPLAAVAAGCRAGWTGRGDAHADSRAGSTGRAAAATAGSDEPVSFPAELLPAAPGGAAWAAFADDDPESGWRHLAPMSRDPMLAAADVVLPLVHGLLGARPDAPLQRLRLQPRIPRDWDRLAVRGLRVGEAEIAIDYRRDGDRHIFALRQDAGPVPIRVIFEPLLPHPRLAAARVDGHDARLDVRPAAGGRVRAPLQLVLDHDRTMEFHGHEDHRAG